MPTTETLVVFLAASLLMNASPGPSTLYVLTRSAAQGRRAGVASALGLTTGSMLHALAAAFGVSAVFAYSPLAYGVIKVVGAAYLVFLGWRMLRDGQVPSEVSPSASGSWRPARVFAQGVVTEVLNPKTALFFLAFLPQFVDPALGPPTGQLLVLGLLVPLTALPVDLAVALGGGAARERMLRNPTMADWLRRAGGTVLVGLGVRLALSEGR
jgi:threonine/homoserine/homoserine lactone efflux protein